MPPAVNLCRKILPGEEACAKHAEYHRQLVNAAAEQLSDKEVDILVSALDKVCAFAVEKAERTE